MVGIHVMVSAVVGMVAHRVTVSVVVMVVLAVIRVMVSVVGMVAHLGMVSVVVMVVLAVIRVMVSVAGSGGVTSDGAEHVDCAAMVGMHPQKRDRGVGAAWLVEEPLA